MRGAKQLADVTEVSADALLAASEDEWSDDSGEELGDMSDEDWDDEDLKYKKQRERELDDMFAGIFRVYLRR